MPATTVLPKSARTSGVVVLILFPLSPVRLWNLVLLRLRVDIVPKIAGISQNPADLSGKGLKSPGSFQATDLFLIAFLVICDLCKGETSIHRFGFIFSVCILSKLPAFSIPIKE